MTVTVRSARLWMASLVAIACLGGFGASAARAWAPGDDGLIAFDTALPGCFGISLGVGCNVSSQGDVSVWTGNPELYTVAPLAGAAPTLVSTNGWDPAWSPDGQHLAFTTPNGIVVSNPDGGGQRPVATNVDTAQGMRSPAWSPDGQNIAYVAQDGAADGITGGASGSSIWMVSATGSGSPSRVLDMPLDIIGRVVWSPDGSQLAFTTEARSWSGGDYGVYVVPAGGGSYRELDSAGGGCCHGFLLWDQLDWGPAGIHAMFQPDRIGLLDPTTIGGPVSAVAVPPLAGYALAPAQPEGPAPGTFAGVFSSDLQLHTFSQSAGGGLSQVQLTFHPFPWLAGDVAWQPVPRCQKVIASSCGTLAPKGGVAVGATSPFLSARSGRLLAAVSCLRIRTCGIVASAYSGQRLLGRTHASLGYGRVGDVAIRFDRRARALLRSGAVRRISLRVQVQHSRKTLARRVIPVGQPSSISAACPAAASVGTSARVSGRLSLASHGSHTVFVVAMSDLGLRRRSVVRTNGDGRFVTKLNIPAAGNWSVFAFWPGSRSVVPASAHCLIRVPPPKVPLPSKLSLACPAQGTAGSPIMVSGALTPAFKGAPVKVTYTEADGTVIVDTVYTDGSGAFKDSRAFDSSGQVQINASVAGSSAYDAANAPPCAVTINASATTITLACPQAATVNGPLEVSGTLTPGFAGAPIQVTYTPPSGPSVTDTVSTDVSGNYSDSTAATQTGTWTIQAFFPGDGQHAPATSSRCTTNVSTAPTTLTLSCPGKASVKGPIGVTGSINPGFAGATIEITYTPPSGPPVTDTATTDASGGFSDSTTATQTGTWTIRAFFPGDSEHAPSASSACTTSVS
jgi:WD40 repeat protein